MSFPRYPKYKPSGVEWLGEVPEGWVLQRLKHSSRIPIKNGLGESADSDDPNQPRYVRITDIKSPRELHESTFKSLPRETAELARFHVGDILFACVGATFGKSYLHSIDAGPMCFAGYLARYSPKHSVDSRFVSYWTESRTFWDQLQANVIQSTIQNFSAAKYRELVLVVPRLPEQTAIAEFLDRETGKIDGLVAEQRRLMELLKEKRQAVISHAVTKGLNPHAPMKPSGIEWLGDVPVGWEVQRIKFVTKGMKAGPFGSALTKDVYVSEGYRVYGQEQVIPNDFTIGDYFITPEKYDELSQYRVSPGDILISCVGTFGKIAIVPVGIAPGIINPRLIRLRCGNSVKSEYLVEVMRSAVTFEQLSSTSRGGTMDIINIGTLSGIFLALPPMPEQLELLTFIHQESAKFDTLTAEAQRAIDLLQERRTALISAAVTGQIDVRNQPRN